jgi:hypothetical protein
VTERSTQRDQLVAQLRFAVADLTARNGQHEFEEAMFQLARLRIATNLLPATGQVTSGGAARPIPIWLGGSSDAAFDRAARLADGFTFFGGGVDRTIDSWNRLRDRVHDLGRSVEDFGADYVVLPQGGIDDLTAEVDAWREARGTHVSLVTMDLGLASADAHIEYLASVAEALH